MTTFTLQDMIRYYNRERQAEAVAKADNDTTVEQMAAHTAHILAKCIQALAWESGVEVEAFRTYTYYTRDTENGCITEEISYKQARIAE